MQVFYSLYGRFMQWAADPHAYWYLFIISFCESSILFIPAEIILIPMVLARSQQTWQLATITTFASVLGGIFSYTLGWLSIDMLQPLLNYTGDWQNYLRAREWFTAWNFGAVLLAAISLIPYKIFAIITGEMNGAFLPFLIASIIGRSIRFFLIATAISLGRSFIEYAISKYAEYIGWSIVLLTIFFGFYYV